MLTFYLFERYIDFNAGIIALATIGTLGIVLKNKLMDSIEKLYLKNKYKAISSFGEKS